MVKGHSKAIKKLVLILNAKGSLECLKKCAKNNSITIKTYQSQLETANLKASNTDILFCPLAKVSIQGGTLGNGERSELIQESFSGHRFAAEHFYFLYVVAFHKSFSLFVVVKIYPL